MELDQRKAPDLVVVIEDKEMTSRVFHTYLGLTIAVASIDLLFIIYLFSMTMMADKRGTVKNCEKVLLFNVLVPDVVLVTYMFAIICPATYYNNWLYVGQTSTWFGFIHLLAVFHAHLAMANICNIITFSVRNPDGYECIATWKHLSALVIAYVSLSISFCALPVVETWGMVYKAYWFTPMITLKHGYGGVFMMVTFMGLLMALEPKSLKELLTIRQQLAVQVDTKLLMRATDDLNAFLSFVSWSMGLNLLLFVCIAEIHGPVLPFIMRMLLYTGPIWRVILLTRRCPHFNFNVKQEEVAMAELAHLVGFDDD